MDRFLKFIVASLAVVALALGVLAIISWLVMVFLGVAHSINPVIPALGYLETAMLVGIIWIILLPLGGRQN